MSATKRPWLLILLAGIATVGSVVLAYELGRFNGGYSVLDQRRERDVLNAEIADREREVENLQRNVAILQTSQEIDRETYAQVEQNLNELQARIQSQEEELAFYRGIISPEDGIAGLRVQTLELRRGDGAHAFLLHLVLVQAITHDRRVSGSVRFDIAGLLNGESVTLDLNDLLADDADRDLAYSFRYFQDLQRQLVLPNGFEPSEVVIQIRPREPSGQVMERTFAWAAVSG